MPEPTLKCKNIFKPVYALVISAALIIGQGVFSYAGNQPAKEELRLEFKPELMKKAEDKERKLSAAVPDAGTGPELPKAKVPGPQGPDTAESKKKLMRSGEICYETKKYTDAVQKWEKALALDPYDKEVRECIKDAVAKIKLQETKQPERPPEAAPAATTVKVTEQPRKKQAGLFNGLFRKETGVENLEAYAGKTAKAKKKEAVSRIPDVLSLKDCIDIASRNHIPLQIAEKSIKLAEMRLFESRRNMLPSASIVFQPYSGRVNGREYLGRKQYIEGTQPVFRGGELYYTMKQADVNLEITKNDRNKIKNELTLQVKKGYYTLAKSMDNLKIQKELSREVERIYDSVNKQFEANITSKLELLNVSSQASQVKYQFTSASGDVSIAELILKQAMNIDPEIKIEIRPKLEFRKIDIDFRTVLLTAMMNRPEVRINTLMVDYYNYGKKISGAKAWPKIDLIGNWGLAKEEYTPEDTLGPTNPTALPANWIFDADQKMTQQYYAGIKASMPLWGSTAEYSWSREQWVPVVSAYQGTEAVTHSFKLKILDDLKYYSDKQLSDIDFDRARQELNKTKQDVTLEAKEGCFNYQKALIQLETASNKVRYQEKDLEFTKIKRGMDEIPDSAVIEAMIKLSQEKFGYVQALTDCHISVASINKAIGVEDYFKDGEELEQTK